MFSYNRLVRVLGKLAGDVHASLCTVWLDYVSTSTGSYDQIVLSPSIGPLGHGKCNRHLTRRTLACACGALLIVAHAEGGKFNLQ